MSHLTQSQRYTTSEMKSKGYRHKEIAAVIGKDKSVVSRELRRNCDLRNGTYRAELAECKYRQRLMEKPRCIKFTAPVREMVEEKLSQKLSPEQIASVCSKEGVACVSAERIYQHVWLDKKQGGKLHRHLRTQGKRYRKRGNSKDARGMIKNRRSIEERPPEVELKERFGDLEIDTIIGKNHQGAILTINDRATGMLRMKKLKNREAQQVKQAALELLGDWKPHLFTLTSDNGKEFAAHEAISEALEIDFFFAHPYHSWERGANENLNGLIRQYIPKATDFDQVTDAFVAQVQEALNNRPRKRFNFESPKYMFNQKVALVT